MSRPTSKPDLQEAAALKYAELQNVISSMSEKELSTDICFENEPSKKEAHWKRDKNLRDVLIHLYEWHQLIIKWIAANIGESAKDDIRVVEQNGQSANSLSTLNQESAKSKTLSALDKKSVKSKSLSISYSFLPSPYTWKTYGDMNVGFWQKHQNTTLEDAKKMLDESHNAVCCLIDDFSNEELFTKGAFNWTGGSVLGSYFVSTTSSHYDWAIKKLKAHRKNCKV